MTQLNTAQRIRLKDIGKAARSGRPTSDGYIIAEGPHLLEEAQASSWIVDRVFGTEEAISRFRNLLENAPVTTITARALASMTTTETTQGLVSVLRQRSWSWNDIVGGIHLPSFWMQFKIPETSGQLFAQLKPLERREWYFRRAVREYRTEKCCGPQPARYFGCRSLKHPARRRAGNSLPPGLKSTHWRPPAERVSRVPICSAVVRW